MGLIGKDLNSLYIIAADELEKATLFVGATKMIVDNSGVVINDGNNGGMVLSQKATDEINDLRQEISTLKSLITSFVPVPNDGGAALKAEDFTGIIKANQGRTYFTSNTLSPTEARNALFLGGNGPQDRRGDQVVTFRYPLSLGAGIDPSTGAWVYPGSLRSGRQIKILRVGANEF